MQRGCTTRFVTFRFANSRPRKFVYSSRHPFSDQIKMGGSLPKLIQKNKNKVLELREPYVYTDGYSENMHMSAGTRILRVLSLGPTRDQLNVFARGTNFSDEVFWFCICALDPYFMVRSIRYSKEIIMSLI